MASQEVSVGAPGEGQGETSSEEVVSTHEAVSPAALSEKALVVRRHIINMIYKAKSGHPGGSLSAADILVALYFGVLRHNPQDPRWPGRDRFVLSKGHAAPALYAVLAEAGYFSVDTLTTLRRWGSILQGHADVNTTPGVEMSAGSLGQGLSFSVGMALAARLDRASYRVYTLLGDGECDEGQVWEAAMAANHFSAMSRLDNLTAILDRNQLQLDGRTSQIMDLEPLADKWRAFGWHVIEVDGHNIARLLDAFREANGVSGRPSVIIAHTVKGKGVSFMENNVDFHGRAPNEKEYKQAIEELDRALEKLRRGHEEVA